MGRVFSASAENLTLGTGNVLIALQTAVSPNAASFLSLIRVEASQSGSTTSAQARLTFSTRDTAGTLTTTAVTPRNVVRGGPASGLSGSTSVIGGVARIGVNSSADSGGAYTDDWPASPNVLNGLLYLPVPEERLLIVPSTVWCARFLAAPAVTTGWNILLVYEELV